MHPFFRDSIMNQDDFQELYISEAEEYLQILNESILDLEKEQDNVELLNLLFRSAHSLKGMAATMGFENVVEISHALENVLDALRHKEITLNREIINMLFTGVDLLEETIRGEEVQHTDDEKRLIERLNEASQEDSGNLDSTKESASSPLLEELELTSYEMNQIKEGYKELLQPLKITITLEEDCIFKSVRIDMALDKMEQMGRIIKTLPPREDLEEENFDLSFITILLTTQEIEEIRYELTHISEVEEVEIHEIDLVKETDERLKKEESEEEREGEEEGDTKLEVEQGEGDQEKKDDEDDEKDLLRKTVTGFKTSNTIKIDVKRLDNLMNLTAELVLNRTQIEDYGKRHNLSELNKILKSLHMVTSNLQNSIMEIRMVPIQQVFRRFPRMVRDLSQYLDKEIDLQMEGEDTELDRTIIDEIGDPIIHLVRNSIDHGIEEKEERKKQGKDPTGRIKIIAYHEGDHVNIEISDDGRGIDIERIKEKAIKNGHITEEEAALKNKQDILGFLFLPGFSTAKSINDVSGRGVGLDVVKTALEKLNGAIDVKTEKGKGSTFILRLPLTLAIIQGFVVQDQGSKYIIPLTSIKEILNLGQAEFKTINQEKVIKLRDEIIPVLYLEELLENGIPEETEREELSVVIAEEVDGFIGIIVDEVLGQQEVVIKQLDNKLTRTSEYVIGATILGDGKVALILDFKGKARKLEEVYNG